MAFKEKLIITKGSDKYPLIRLRNKNTKDPIDLTGITTIQVIMKTSDRGELIFRNVAIPATKAKISKGAVTISAVTAGAVGNAIALFFDGVDTLNQVLQVWNDANPSNTATHNGLGTEVFPEGQLYLTNGYNSYIQIEPWGDPQLGKILIRMTEKDTLKLRTGINQPLRIVLDFGLNPGGIRNVGYFENALEIIGEE